MSRWYNRVGVNVRSAGGKGRRKTDLSNDELRDLKYSKTIAGWVTEKPEHMCETTMSPGTAKDCEHPDSCHPEKPKISHREGDPLWIYFEAGGRMIGWYGARTDELRLHNSRDFTVREWDYVEHLSCRLSPYGRVVWTGRLRVARPSEPEFETLNRWRTFRT